MKKHTNLALTAAGVHSPYTAQAQAQAQGSPVADLGRGDHQCSHPAAGKATRPLVAAAAAYVEAAAEGRSRAGQAHRPRWNASKAGPGQTDADAAAGAANENDLVVNTSNHVNYRTANNLTKKYIDK